MQTPLRNLHVEQRRILLRAEHVGVALAAARDFASDRELDRLRRLEHDKTRDAVLANAKELRHRLLGQRTRALHALVVRLVAADDVEGDVIDARVLAADGRGEFNKLHMSSPVQMLVQLRTVSRWGRNSDSGSSTSIA